jgi:hypothetical protein
MSNMYSLLNYIAATSKEIYETSSSSQMMSNPLYSPLEQGVMQSVETGLHGLSEEEKRLVGISTISVVTRLALEFGMEEVPASFLEELCYSLIPLLGHSSDYLHVAAEAPLRRANCRGGNCVQSCGSSVICA